MNNRANVRAGGIPLDRRRVATFLGAIAAWLWGIFGGFAGLWLLITTGPWPPTHGWFVLCSGLAVWPVTAWACKRYLGLTLSPRLRVGAAAAFVLAGRVAVTFLWPRPEQRVSRPDWVAILSGIILLAAVVNGVRAYLHRASSRRLYRS